MITEVDANEGRCRSLVIWNYSGLVLSRVLGLGSPPLNESSVAGDHWARLLDLLVSRYIG